ncbi:MAG: anthranilate synthase component I family protein [Acidobacteriota bacterium]
MTALERWTPVSPVPDPADVLLGLAVLEERGRDLAPCYLGADLAWHGEAPRPITLVGAVPDALLPAFPRGEPTSAFPWEPGVTRQVEGLQRFVDQIQRPDTDHAPGGLPFGGGVTVGWLGHELAASRLVRYRSVLVHDPAGGAAWWVTPRGERPVAGLRLVREAERLGRMARAGLARAAGRAARGPGPPAWVPVGEIPYAELVRRVKCEIAAGNVYQVNLSHEMRVRVGDGGPVALATTFLDLLARNPVRFPAFVGVGDTTVLAFSPERYVARRGRRVESCPIKGTRPRARQPEEDRRLARELLASPKDLAENVMIVDLVRNDLGRVAAVGGVSVPGLCEIQSLASVHHLVSTVQAQLRRGVRFGDIVAAVHPAGSMTGAPKVRAVDILTRLEARERGAYAGGVGWFAGDTCFDLAMVIRSLVVRDGEARLPVGGGIVADSDPVAEYRETLDKARSLVSVGAAAAAVPGERP